MAGENEISVGAEVAGEKLDSQNAVGGMGTDLRWPLLACDPSPCILSLPGSLGQIGAQFAQKAGKQVASRCCSFSGDSCQSRCLRADTSPVTFIYRYSLLYKQVMT